MVTCIEYFLENIRLNDPSRSDSDQNQNEKMKLENLEKHTSALFDFILPPSKGIVFKSIEVPSLSPFLSTFEINILIRRPISNRIMSTVISTMEITPQCGTK